VKSSPLQELEDKKVGEFLLHLGEVKQLRLSSWKGFELYIKKSNGILSLEPVIKGIFSSGAKDGVKSWMDLVYCEELDFKGDGSPAEKLSLGSKGLDRRLFQTLGNLIPPGGHLMVSYEGETPVHKNTIESLSIRIPAAATALGFLLFRSGFQLIKDWYLSEGGFEGPRKLWAEKAPDSTWAKTFYAKTAAQMESFLEKERRPELRDLEEPARERAREILKIIDSEKT
jgi:hypothetical protein